jgi:hypothetical protein
MNYFKGIEYPCYLSEYTITNLFRHIPHYVFHEANGIVGEVSSALPYLVSILAKESKIKTIYAGEEWHDEIWL